jgi:hypothetical protein
LRAIAGPNNSGTSFTTTNPTRYYLLTGYSSTLTFPISPAGEYSATNINTGSLAVSAGDRIALRIIVSVGNNDDIGQVTELGFNASLTYTRT